MYFYMYIIFVWATFWNKYIYWPEFVFQFDFIEFSLVSLLLAHIFFHHLYIKSWNVVYLIKMCAIWKDRLKNFCDFRNLIDKKLSYVKKMILTRQLALKICFVFAMGDSKSTFYVMSWSTWFVGHWILNKGLESNMSII